jgi:carbamoyltransferase
MSHKNWGSGASMLTLGWHGGSTLENEASGVSYARHDAAAAILKDGCLIAAIEEERLSRIKHSNSFPYRAIRYCLDYAGVKLGDLDQIAVDSGERELDRVGFSGYIKNPRLAQVTGRQWIGNIFQKVFGVDVGAKLRFCQHHLAHAYSTFFPSSFDEAIIFCPDGEGDGLSGIIAVGRGKNISILQQIPDRQSIGQFYIQMIKLIGYRRFDEYKVMGLAPYGNPEAFGPILQSLIKLLPGGFYKILPLQERLEILTKEGLLKNMRRRGEPFSQRDKDIAAALQWVLESVVLHVLTHFQRMTGIKNLCLAGGVAHNCTLNGKILTSGLFERIFVQPAAHDAGNAIGAALYAYAEEGGNIDPSKVKDLYLGSDIGSEKTIFKELRKWGNLINFERQKNITKVGAELLASGNVIGWVQGRSEFGPRALGNRSILADPRPAENKEIINQMIKKRESFRPFAPSVQREKLHEIFVVPDEVKELPYMIFVVGVREEYRKILGAITHVDGTARVQSVSRESNPRYWNLIDEFGAITGIPVVLNTSFNNNAEPIVDSVEDAVSCFLTTGIHALIVGDYLIHKGDISPSDKRLGQLIPELRPSRKLEKGSQLLMDGSSIQSYFIGSNYSDYFGETHTTLSRFLYEILAAADGRRTLGELCEELGITSDPELEMVTKEAYELWQRRVLVLRPNPLFSLGSGKLQTEEKIPTIYD